MNILQQHRVKPSIIAITCSGVVYLNKWSIHLGNGIIYAFPFLPIIYPKIDCVCRQLLLVFVHCRSIRSCECPITVGSRFIFSGRAYATVLHPSVVCRSRETLCIVVKRCVLEKKLLLTAYWKSHIRNPLAPK